MKVIDLLNKIANGEEVSEKIKFENVIYEYDKERKDYINKLNDWHSETLLFNVMNCHFIKEILENEVELIEDNTIDIDSIEELEMGTNVGSLHEVVNQMFRNRRQQNEILQAVKQLNKEIKELKELDVEVSEKDINEALNLTLDKAFHHHYYEKEK